MKDGLPHSIRIEDPSWSKVVDMQDWLIERGYLYQQEDGSHELTDRTVMDMTYQQECKKTDTPQMLNSYPVGYQTKMIPVYYFFFNDPKEAIMFKLTWC